MLQKFNKVMDYIEEHLEEDILSKDISQITGLSDYHFKKMFLYLSGMPLNEYIRNRQFSKANIELINDEKVTNLAFKFGYQSVEGFSRAFKDWSGLLPSEVSKNKFYKSFHKLSFFMDIRGGFSMEFKIEKKEKFNIVGVTKKVPIQFTGENNAIIDLAKSITNDQKKKCINYLTCIQIKL